MVLIIYHQDRYVARNKVDSKLYTFGTATVIFI